MVKAVYPGTFDPLTLGHVDLIERAGLLFDEVIIAIANNHSKTPLMSVDERQTIITNVFKNQPNVQVLAVEGLLVDFVESQGAHVVLRGLRTASDFDYEFQMAGMNRCLNPKIETVFLTPSESFSFMSSTLVREIVALGGDVSQFVPEAVLKWLSQKLVSF